jgi:hypothetical protein
MDKQQKLISKKRLRKCMRYIIMFLSLFISTQYIPECSINYSTSFMMAAIAAITFCIIDMYFPILCN